MKRRQAANKENNEMLALRLNIDDIYGGMIPERVKEDVSLPLLAASIAKHGLLQPVVVQKNEDVERYKLVCGARRLAACRMLGRTTIDAILLTGDKLEAMACFMEEHMTRKPVSLVENAALFAQAGMMSRCVLPQHVAKRYVRLLALNEQTQSEITSLSLEQAEPLLLITQAERQLEAARTIVQRNLTPVQARRMALQAAAVQEKPTGKRRTVRSVMESLQRICEELKTQGISASIGIHAQNQGICMQIFIKNG